LAASWVLKAVIQPWNSAWSCARPWHRRAAALGHRVQHGLEARREGDVGHVQDDDARGALVQHAGLDLPANLSARAVM
jgi:hypothetical protein